MCFKTSPPVLFVSRFFIKHNALLRVAVINQFLILSFVTSTRLCADHASVIESYINWYKRPVTILEIGVDSIAYGLSLAQKYDSTVVELLIGKLPHTFHYALEKHHRNIVILNPRAITLNNLETLTRCEHFDIVIVRDIPTRLKKNHILLANVQATLDLLLKLGDATFIELPANNGLIRYLATKHARLVSKTKTELFYVATPKKGLDIARWSVRHLAMQETPRYQIVSNFEEKLYIKEDKRIMWLKGINLLTFIMLRGICPCDATIARNITGFRTIKHNDLIIGNMVIQGDTVVAVDVNDPRWDANLDYCIKAAITVFSGNKWRLKNPEQCFQAYRDILSKEP